MKSIAIYGAGGMGREVLLLIQTINRVAPAWTIVGFFDDGVSALTVINGMPVLSNMATLNQWPEPLAVVVAIAKTVEKRSVVGQITNPAVWFPTLIHPAVALSAEHFCTVGAGSLLSAGIDVMTNITIGQHVFVNLHCTIGHDVIIGDFCALMPGVHVSGGVSLGAGVYLGTGVALINGVSVGEGTIVGAGAVVTKPLPAHCIAIGVPAKVVRYQDT